jgi:magnesium-transporting ATPase (P-type)
MKSVLSHLTFFAWALWFGANIAVFVFGFHFFAAMPRETARESARAMFQVFGPYEMILAGAAVLCSAGLLAMNPTKWTALLVFLLVIAGAMVIAQTLGIMHRLEFLHAYGKVGTPEWLKWHIKSMKLNGMQAIVLLAAGLVLPQATRKTDPSITAAHPSTTCLPPH